MDIDQLRRRAKDLVRAARRGDPDALARLGDLPLKLASAQLVLARDAGSSSWPALVHATRGADPCDVLVEALASEGWRPAFERLMQAGSDATGALRRGLMHDAADVRMRCCMVLDHHLDDAAIPELMANLGHPSGRVRGWALHALACDRCKEGDCRPSEDATVPLALALLQRDRSRKVRTMAASVLGDVAPRRPDVAAALAHARDHDTHPVVRTVAGWYAPGGRNYEKRRAATTR